MNEFEQLESLLARITNEIKTKQSEIMRLALEVENLQNQAKSLDAARALLLSTRPAGEGYARKLSPNQPISLQDEIIKCLESTGEAGETLGGVVGMLKERNYPNSDSKSFYPNVFTTLRRLVAKGRVVEFLGEGNRKRYKIEGVNRDTERDEPNNERMPE